MRFVSLFAGVGGFDLGFENVGWTCVGQVEIDKNARAVLDQHWPDVPKHDDVVTAKEWADECGLVGNVDLVCGGFPCQDVSVAGKRAGLAGERTGLFWDALSFATHVQAGWLVLENVPGLLSSNGGRDFGVVLSAMADAGYRHIEWRVLDSQFLGVAQRRRRVFVVGHTRTPRSGAVLVEREGVCGDSAKGAASREDVAGTLGGGSGSRGWACDTDRMTFVPVERKPDPFDDPATAESWDQYVDSLSLSLSLANSSSMQDVASTVTTGTGVRYDPDTESLVVLSQTRSER
jgi:DNA (cytosine-5)-methyltransferase 1